MIRVKFTDRPFTEPRRGSGRFSPMAKAVPKPSQHPRDRIGGRLPHARVVCQWIGNSQPIAAKHYLQVTDDHYAKALQQPAVLPRTRSQAGSAEDEKTPVCDDTASNYFFGGQSAPFTSVASP